MNFYEWITSTANNPKINGQWGTLHIIVLVACIGIIVTLALLLRKRSDKARKIVIWVLVGLIAFFELARRIINLCKNTDWSASNIAYILIPRPWCAISCWCLMASAFVNKKFFYNFASVTALLCSVIFFAYPGAGFNNVYIEFENLYSIATHSLLLITSITLITLKFTDFKYKGCWKELICLAVVFLYAGLEIALNIESDPLYFMPGNDVQEIFGVGYGAFIVIYIVFMLIYLNAFYLINEGVSYFKNRKKTLQSVSQQEAAQPVEADQPAGDDQKAEEQNKQIETEQ